MSGMSRIYKIKQRTGALKSNMNGKIICPGIESFIAQMNPELSRKGTKYLSKGDQTFLIRRNVTVTFDFDSVVEK
jgi:hypothetical protein